MKINWVFAFIYAALAAAFIWGVFYKNKNTKKKIYWGFHVIYFALVFGFLANFIKIIDIQYFTPEEYWQDIKHKVEYRVVDDIPKRGSIYCYDRNGEKVILSEDFPIYELHFNGLQLRNIVDAIKKKEITVDGGKFYDKEKDNINDLFNVNDSINKLAEKLANYFKDRDKSDYAKLIYEAYNGKKRKRLGHTINILQFDEISKFPLFNGGKDKTYGSCLDATEKKNRMMPYGDLAKRTIGAVDREQKYGNYGIEWQYDSILKGVAGKKRLPKISINKRVDEVLVRKQKGADITLTLDMDIQEIVATALRPQAQKLGAERACAIVMEVETGEIKAMVNLGGGDYSETGINFGNMAVSSNNELGSVFKVPSIMAAIENKFVTDSSLVYVRKSKYGNVYDTHPFNTDSASVLRIIAESSNIGTSNALCNAYYKNQKGFYDAISKIYFDAPINFDLPAPQPKIETAKSNFEHKVYGYVWVSPLYMLRFFNAIANNGKMINPFIIKDIIKNKKSISGFPRKRGEIVTNNICSEGTLKSVQNMLFEVINSGNVKNHKSEIITIAGKTGTADILESKVINGVRKAEKVASQGTFCGYFPVEKPKYTCIVVMYKITKTENLYGVESYGVFRNIAEKIFIMENTHEFPQLDNSENKINIDSKKITQLRKKIGVK